jgi:hypothetical protein
MRKSITIKFDFGDPVALKTDPFTERVITGIVLRPSGKMYELANGIDTSWHQDVEVEKFPIKTEKKKAGFIKE